MGKPEMKRKDVDFCPGNYSSIGKGQVAIKIFMVKPMLPNKATLAIWLQRMLFSGKAKYAFAIS